MNASVIVCTRNPDPARLTGLVRALSAQSADPARWEWIVVDNGSDPPVDAAVFPARVRLVREEREGLTPARLRGIRESTGGLLIFFDDDNAPDPDYVETAMNLYEEQIGLGAAGGRIDPVYERSPPRWAAPYLGWLAIRPHVTEERPAGLSDPWGRLPCGAGLCIRAEAARRYADATEADPIRMALGRRGGVLTGSDDTDLVLAALDMGYGALLTPRLRLRHAIPAARLEADYLERLLEGSAYSAARLERRRGIRGRPAWLNRLLRRLKRVLPAHPADWAPRLRMERALDRGEAAGRAAVSGPDGGRGTPPAGRGSAAP